MLTAEKSSPPSARVCKLGIPLVDCVLTSHTHVAARTNGLNIVKRRCTASAFGDIMPALEIKHGHSVRAPHHLALCFEDSTRLDKPNLFAQSLWNLMLGTH
jgi:hypothetical protein